jgi:hypothetical protein
MRLATDPAAMLKMAPPLKVPSSMVRVAPAPTLKVVPPA